MTREFFIQRYAVDQWPHIRGELPWVIRGPNYERGFEIAHDFDELPVGRAMRQVIAEELLYEGVLSTAWVVSGNIPSVLPIGDALEKSIREIALSLAPDGSSWSEEIIWLLEMTSPIDSYISYTAEDHLRVVPMTVPTRVPQEPSEGDMMETSDETARSPEPTRRNE